MADADTHGPLFDRDFGVAVDGHGGSYYDSGFPLQEIRNAHGRLYDLFGATRGLELHGDRFDEFGWSAMPDGAHGVRFDEGFRQEIANTEHGVWYDAFRGGAQAKFVYDGQDYTGLVQQINDTFATVLTEDGQQLEVNFDQFTAFQNPSFHNATVAIPASTQPTQSEPANGGHLRALKTIVDRLTVAKAAREDVPHTGGYKVKLEHRSGTLVSDGHLCHDCASKAARSWEVAKPGAKASLQPTGRNAGQCDRCGSDLAITATAGNASASAGGGSGTTGKTLRETLDLLKSVDSTETATQGQPDSDGSGITERDKGGQLASGPRVCPHCGMKLLDDQTEQGQPSRKDREGGPSTHKCLAGALNVLKEAAATPVGCKGCGGPLLKVANGKRFCPHCGREEKPDDHAPDEDDHKGAIPVTGNPDMTGADSR